MISSPIAGSCGKTFSLISESTTVFSVLSSLYKARSSHMDFSVACFSRESALFLLILSALFISAPVRSSTYELQSASQCHSRFFQYRLRHTPSALSPPPCTPCHLKRERERERVMNTVPGFDTVVWVI